MKAFLKGLIILIMFVCCSCGNSQNNTEANAAKVERNSPFFRSELPGGHTSYDLIINAETGIQYLCMYGYMSGKMTILVDAEGNPIHYGNRELMPAMPDRFFTIKFPSDNSVALIVDKVTKVQYLWHVGLALYADADGKPILYKGPIPSESRHL